MREESRETKPGIIAQLRQETEQFAQLCERYTRHINAGRRGKQLQKLRRGVTRNRTLLKTLAQKAEACEGAYQSIVAACRAIALAEIEFKSGD